MIKVIPRENFDDILWDKYFRLSRDIIKKHYPEGYDPHHKFLEFKEFIMNLSKNDESFNDFLILNCGTASAWFDSSVWEDVHYAGFDYLSDDVNENVLNAAFEKLYEINTDLKCSHTELVTYREKLINYLKSIDTPVIEDIHLSRLIRENMDASLYKEIIENSDLKRWNTKCLNEIPGEIITEFVKSINKCFEDRDSLNKDYHHYPPLTSEEWYKDKQNLKSLGTNLEFLILFDDNNKIAGFCWVCIDSYRKNTVRHNGGFTAVNPGYRGKGIAKYLKAKMYLKLLEENKDFKYVTTDTMPWNKYMYKINEEFGFKTYKRGCSFKLNTDFFRSYLNK